jgi:hypothetical protein
VERRRLSVYFLYLAWRLWKSVVTLAVTGITIFAVGLFGVTGCPYSSGIEYRYYRNRWDIRWVSGRGKTPTFCVFPVFSVAVMEKCCDGYGERETYFRSDCSASEGACISIATFAFYRKSMGHTVGERSWNAADILCISCI